MIERRRSPRSRPSVDIGFFAKDTKERVGSLVDISTEGIMLVGGRPMTVNTMYELKIILPIAIYGNREIVFDAVCLWCKKISHSGNYQAGFQLQKASAKVKALFRFWLGNSSFLES